MPAAAQSVGPSAQTVLQSMSQQFGAEASQRAMAQAMNAGLTEQIAALQKQVADLTAQLAEAKKIAPDKPVP
jgi:uncharacterized small protein (DUF1192 family)